MCVVGSCSSLPDASRKLDGLMDELQQFSFMCTDDLMAKYREFQDSQPTALQHTVQVEKWHALEVKVRVWHEQQQYCYVPRLRSAAHQLITCSLSTHA